MTEDDYCDAFATALRDDQPFRHWVLTQCGFPDRRWSRLLHDEQSLRPAKQWWRHWWTELPDGSQSETDVFAVFEDGLDEVRFALHVECKRVDGKFMPRQAEQYSKRAEFMKANRWVPYSQFATILLAPQSFALRFPDETVQFGSFIAFESVAQWLPSFQT